MKKLLLLILFFATTFTFSQENKSDCVVNSSFKEPVRTKKMKKWAKKMNKFNQGAFPTLKEIKSHVSIDNDCELGDVTLLKMEEQAGNGIYILCVKGKKIKYKRMGTVILKDGENPFSKQ
jgi:hypothetical protein